MLQVKRSTAIIVVGCAVALLVPVLWIWSALRSMSRELADWKAAQVAFVATRPTPEQVVPRTLVGPDTASVIKGDDGMVEFVVITGPQWHYATLKFDKSERAVAVTFSAK